MPIKCPIARRAWKNEYNRQRYQLKKESILSKNKKHYHNNKDSYRLRHRKWKLKTSYNLTLEQYHAMYEQQEGKCKICQMHMDKVCIDHCHETNKVRGLLCDNCNKAIGLMKDNPYVLMSARQYLVLNM